MFTWLVFSGSSNSLPSRLLRRFDDQCVERRFAQDVHFRGPENEILHFDAVCAKKATFRLIFDGTENFGSKRALTRGTSLVNIPKNRSYVLKKFNVADGRHLEKWIRHHNFVADGLIWTKFSMPMQNGISTMTQRWKSKPKVEFQHGGRLFSEAGNNNVSPVDWDISPKFGMLCR